MNGIFYIFFILSVWNLVYFTITAHLNLCYNFSLEIFDLCLAFIKLVAEKVHLHAQVKLKVFQKWN